jgi:hypothetical protein
MGVAVESEVGAPLVDRLGQEMAAEEREDLQALAAQRVLDRRVVRERDAHVGVEVEQCVAQAGTNRSMSSVMRGRHRVGADPAHQRMIDRCGIEPAHDLGEGREQLLFRGRLAFANRTHRLFRRRTAG